MTDWKKGDMVKKKSIVEVHVEDPATNPHLFYQPTTIPRHHKNHLLFIQEMRSRFTILTMIVPVPSQT